MKLPDWFLFWQSLKLPAWWVDSVKLSLLSFHFITVTVPRLRAIFCPGATLHWWQSLSDVPVTSQCSAETSSSRQQLFGQRNDGVQVVHVKRKVLVKPFFHQLHDYTFSMTKARHWVWFATTHQHVFHIYPLVSQSNYSLTPCLCLFLEMYCMNCSFPSTQEPREHLSTCVDDLILPPLQVTEVPELQQMFKVICFKEFNDVKDSNYKLSDAEIELFYLHLHFI